jgi:hypothetical protein
MGVLSISAIVISLTCLAVLMGLVIAVVFVWPRKTEDDHETSRIKEPSKPDQTSSEQE